MEMLLAVVVFLVGACLGVLVGMLMLLSRLLDRVEAMHHQVAELLRESADTAAEISHEQRRHLDAANAVLVDQVRRVGRGLVAELREAARGQQTSRWSRQALSPHEAHQVEPSRPGSEPVRGAMPGASTLPPDAPTPQSGMPVGELLRHKPALDFADDEDG
ncbi:MAG: hypothetical protein R3B70_18705 [Polyangiaceae bacterium]